MSNEIRILEWLLQEGVSLRFLDTIDISASGLTAQRLRMDTIAVIL